MFDMLIVRPFGWILKGCYNLFGSYGLAIILFTLVSKIVLLPLQMKSKKSMMRMQSLQPKLDELSQRYGNDKEKYSLAVQKLYKQENVSLFGGCLPMLLMFPIMFGLYYAVRQPFTYMFGASGQDLHDMAQLIVNTCKESGGVVESLSNYNVYEAFIGSPEDWQDLENFVISNFANYKDVISASFPQFANIDFTFMFSWLDLAKEPTLGVEYPDPLLVIPVLSGITSWLTGWVSRLGQPKPKDPAQQKGKMMTILMPCMSIWIAFMVPAGLGLYWIMSNLFSAIQEPVLTAYYKKKMITQEAQK